MMKKFLLTSLIFAFSMCGAAHADELATTEQGYAALDRFLNGLQSLQSDFVQTVQDNRDQVIEKSTGKLAIRRPGKFRWDYDKPNAQTIVCDGKRIWVYDPELQQVTIRSVDGTISGTPATLLSGNGMAGSDLKKNFNVVHAEHHEDMLVINLSPKRDDSDFKLVQLALHGDVLVAMSLTDKLDQRTLVEFRQFKRNASLPDSEFAFTPPKDVDVIDNSQATTSKEK
ncbi:MAG: outer membrane lipoprotein chaperone LolA [Steroidobacter sp.]